MGKLRKTLLAIAVALVLVGLAPGPANALTQVVTASISKPTSTSVKCSGFNNVEGSNAMDDVGVSYVCQYQDGAGAWHDVNPPAGATVCDDQNTCSGSETINCSNDGLPAGTWVFRGQADGWHVHYNGTRHDFPGTDVTSTTKSYTCTS